MIKSIVVPTDGSDHADKAVELAADMAEKYGARVVVLHTLLRHTADADLRDLCQKLKAPAELTKMLDELQEQMIEAASASMTPYTPIPLPVPNEVLDGLAKAITDKASAVLAGKGVKNVDVRIADGSPADIILGAAEHEKADMIVMGSRGLGKFADMLMGSVSHKVSHLAPCTCVTVK